MTTTIAFIGLGNMGLPMAANLVKAGFNVIGYDLAANAKAAAEAAGVKFTASVAEAVRNSAVVITMLPAGKQVLAVWKDLTRAAKPGTVFIDSSTIDVESARMAHKLAAEAGMLSLDAPVSGGTVGAAAATLTFMVGGAADAFTQGEPVLSKMGKRLVPCGGPGAGQAAKICNNMILGISMVGVAEAFVLGERLGLSHQALFDVASTSSGQCWALSSNCPVPGPVPTSPANRDYRPGFATDLMLKDLRLAQEAALSANAATPMGAQAAALYAIFAQLGHGGEDFSAVIKFFRGEGANKSSNLT